MILLIIICTITIFTTITLFSVFYLVSLIYDIYSILSHCLTLRQTWKRNRINVLWKISYITNKKLSAFCIHNAHLVEPNSNQLLCLYQNNKTSLGTLKGDGDCLSSLPCWLIPLPLLVSPLKGGWGGWAQRRVVRI